MAVRWRPRSIAFFHAPSASPSVPRPPVQDVLITTARFAISFVPRLELGEAKVRSLLAD